MRHLHPQINKGQYIVIIFIENIQIYLHSHNIMSSMFYPGGAAACGIGGAEM